MLTFHKMIKYGSVYADLSYFGYKINFQVTFNHKGIYQNMEELTVFSNVTLSFVVQWTLLL